MILKNLRPAMTVPEVIYCFDNHFQRVIYSIGPYIADYPEQALLACIVQGWCPRCVRIHFFQIFSKLKPRCMANYRDLDGNGGQHSRQHTRELVKEFQLGTLWDEYGLVEDIIVCQILAHF